MQLANQIISGDRRALAKAISMVENNASGKVGLMDEIYKQTGQAQIIGITGPPGVGKSSLVDKLASEYRKQGKKIGIIAVDPSSPFSGGALLGDRVRMTSLSSDENVFIRSMSSRGHLGGLAVGVRDTIKLLDAFGMDIVLVETVGVGQSEMEVMYAVDTTVLVLTPVAGDMVQVMKAGVMEIADIYVINKADISGADKARSELEELASLKRDHLGWHLPIILASAINEKGISGILNALKEHKLYIRENSSTVSRREQQLEMDFIQKTMDYIKSTIEERWVNNGRMKMIAREVLGRKLKPSQAINKVLADITREWAEKNQ